MRDWPVYLLKNIPTQVREGIERDAGTASMAEVIRSVLCAHFSLDCEEVVSRNRFEPVSGTRTMALRLQPELWRAIRQEASERGVPHRTVIVDALAAHFQTPVT